MIKVDHISKDFVAPKKYPGLKGAIKGLFSNEKITKTAVDDISFTIEKVKSWDILAVMALVNPPLSK